MSKRVWTVVKDPGGTNGVLPVVKVLRERGVHVDVIAHGKAPELSQVKEFGTYLVAGPDPQAVLATLSLPDAYITSMCSEGGVGRDLIPFLRERGVPTIAAQDFWGGALVRLFSDQKHWPDYIWVNDDLGADIVQRAWAGFLRENIWVTGFPAMDKYAAVDVEGTRARVRRTLGVKGQLPLALFAGDLKGTSAVLAQVIAAFNKLAQESILCAFAPRQHPRMTNDSPEESPLWQGALERFIGGQLLADTSSVATPEMVAAADVVVANFSTVLIEAACLRKQVIAINDEAQMAQFREAVGGIMNEFPLVELGCAHKTTSPGEMRDALRSGLQGKLDLREAQENHFALDGKNAERAAERVLALLE